MSCCRSENRRALRCALLTKTSERSLSEIGERGELSQPAPASVSPTQRRLIASCILLAVLLHLAMLYLMYNPSAKPDFSNLYAAGKAVLNQKRFHARAQVAASEDKHDGTAETKNQPSSVDKLHPPFEMLIFGPLALLKYRTAYMVWYSCNLVMLFSVPFLLWDHIPHLHKCFAYLLVPFATFIPVFVAVLQGQDSILLLLFLTLCFIWLSNRHEFRAGVALAMGMFKFVLIVPIVIGLALERRWRTLAGFACGCLALLCAALALVGSASVLGYVRFMSGYGTTPIEIPGKESLMPNLRGFIYTVGAGVLPRAGLAIATLIASALIIVIIDRPLLSQELHHAGLDLRFSMQVVLATIVSYHLFPHDFSILLLPLLLTLNRCVGSGFRSPFGSVLRNCRSCHLLLSICCPLACLLCLRRDIGRIVRILLYYQQPVYVTHHLVGLLRV